MKCSPKGKLDLSLCCGLDFQQKDIIYGLSIITFSTQGNLNVTLLHWQSDWGSEKHSLFLYHIVVPLIKALNPSCDVQRTTLKDCTGSEYNFVNVKHVYLKKRTFTISKPSPEFKREKYGHFIGTQG